MFGTILLIAAAVMHALVFVRLASVPFVAAHVPRAAVWLIGAAMWALVWAGRHYRHGDGGAFARALEDVGMTWLAVVFLMFTFLLAAELVTGFGFLFRRYAPSVRTIALATALLLAVIGIIQGNRPPVIVDYEVRLRGLPSSLDGTVIAALADLHLGRQRGPEWMEGIARQTNDLKPDMIVLLGDIIEGHDPPPKGTIAALGRLKAPLGVYGVLGNHEFHGGGLAAGVYFRQAGIRLLRDEWTPVAPGLVLSGVDDLTSRSRRGMVGDPVTPSLAGHPPGAAIHLSHTPWGMEQAAAAGAGLMLSGHTHGGQVWPFGYLVRLRYPYIAGRHEVDGMTLIVSRGAGAWGPRLRLWHPAEILHITLRSED